MKTLPDDSMKLVVTSPPSCQFPVELVERLVLSMTEVGDSVFDPYMGVGSSIVAALMHDRAAWGCDTAPRYVDIARERVRALSV